MPNDNLEYSLSYNNRYYFISFKSEDESRIRSILQKFNQYGVPFWDYTRLSPGQNWQVAITENIRDCEAIIFFVTKKFFESNYVNLELRIAINYKKTIYVVFLENIATKDIGTRGLAMYFTLQQHQILDVSEHQTDNGIARQCIKNLRLIHSEKAFNMIHSSSNFDVFISYKHTKFDNSGTTRDYEIASDLHNSLLQNGVNTFFSEKDLSTSEFTKQIYQALDQAKILVVVGTCPEYVNSEWVSAEWSFFHAALLGKRKEKGEIYTFLEGMSQNKLPPELYNRQSYNTREKNKLVERIIMNLRSF